MYLLKEGVSKEKGVGTGVLRPGVQVRKAEKEPRSLSPFSRSLHHSSVFSVWSLILSSQTHVPRFL